VATPDNRRRWISPREAADILGIHTMTAYAWIASGLLPSARIGRKVFIDRRLLEEGLEAQIQETRR
jgi:excisionase family DNA binding protein